jgi:hypothetical protein
MFTSQKVSFSMSPVWAIATENAIKYEPSIRQEHSLGDIAMLYKSGLQIAT